MEQANREHSAQSSINQGADFHGASLVTAAGKEIPITEQMLEKSFNMLIEAWESAQPLQKR